MQGTYKCRNVKYSRCKILGIAMLQAQFFNPILPGFWLLSSAIDFGHTCPRPNCCAAPMAGGPPPSTRVNPIKAGSSPLALVSQCNALSLSASFVIRPIFKAHFSILQSCSGFPSTRSCCRKRHVTVAMRAAGMVLNETSTCLVQTFYLTDYSLDVIHVQRS